VNAPTTLARADRPRRGSRLRHEAAPYAFLSPYLIIFAVFWAWPIVYSIVLSFQDSRLGSAQGFTLANWSRLANDPFFHGALRNTLLILAVQVPTMLALALGLAVALNSPLLRLKGLYRFAFFAPLVVGTVAYSAVFRLLFNTQFGAVNALLESVGLGRVDWLFSTTPAMILIMLAMTWRWTGYNAIILLAGLQSIPTELYEAASIDGAGPWTQFTRITLPMLRPSLLFTLVLSIIGTLQLFTEPALITNSIAGGPTQTLGTYLYQQGFRSFNFGYASAIAYTVALIAGVFSIIQLRLFGRES
jgi:lactose/L-arabinose transport system permease protein